jgi:hypothetical protein
MVALANDSIKVLAISPLLQIAMHFALHDIELDWVWIPIQEHTPADALSSWETGNIAYLCPNLQQKQFKSPTMHQTPGKKTATSPLRLHDIFGGDSDSNLGQHTLHQETTMSTSAW